MNKNFTITKSNKKLLTIYTVKYRTCQAKAYIYKDDPYTIYLSSLYVNHTLRNQGIATKLQTIREQLGRKLKANQACLWSRKHSWLIKWLIRRNYRPLKNHSQTHIWLAKSISPHKSLQHQ